MIQQKHCTSCTCACATQVAHVPMFDDKAVQACTTLVLPEVPAALAGHSTSKMALARLSRSKWIVLAWHVCSKFPRGAA